MTTQPKDKNMLVEGELQLSQAGDKDLQDIQDIFFNGPVVVFSWENASGWPVKYVSPNVDHIYGYSINDFYSRRVRYADVIAEEDLERVNAEVTTAGELEIQFFEHQPYRIVHRDGSVRWVKDYSQVVRNELNEITHYNGYILDITEAHETESSLKDAYEELQLTLENRSSELSRLSVQVNQAIHQRVLLEQDLEKSEFKYRQLMEEAYDAILVVDNKSGKIINANHKAIKITGYSLEQLKGMMQQELFNPHNIPLVMEIMAQIDQVDEYFLINLDLLDSDGHTVPVEGGASLVRLDDHNVIQWVFRDVTQKRESERLLVESEQQYRAVFENALDGILLINQSTLDFIDCNKTLCQMLDYSYSELLSKNLDELFRDEDQLFGLNQFGMLLKGKNTLVFSIPLLKRGGGLVYTDISGTAPFRLNDKDCVVCVVRDITERIQAITELESERRRLRTIVEEIPALICIKDSEGRWLEANRKLLELYKLSNVDYQGKTNEQLIKFIPPDLTDAFNLCAEYDRRAWLEGRQIQLDIECSVEDETPFIFDINKIPLFDQSGKPQELLVIGHDITERKRDENERLSQIERQQELVVGEVHHRIKNHLQGLIGLLRQHQKNSQENIGLIEVVISQIASIAAVYGLEANRSGASIQLDKMLQAIVQSVNGLSVIPIESETGSFSSGMDLDRNKAVALALVINELLMNAVKHSVRQHKRDVILISERVQEEYLVLSIRNPGTLPEEFSLEQKSGLGTGLELASAMLPADGARLEIISQNHEVVATLMVSSPLLSNHRE